MTMTLYIFPCDEDPGPLSKQDAHRLMQLHIDCQADICRARRRARTTLVEAKAMVLDERAVP